MRLNWPQTVDVLYVAAFLRPICGFLRTRT